MNQLIVHCPAKVNLTLGIQGKRLDGYHELETIMQSISLEDTLYLSSEGTGISLVADYPGLPVGEDNLIYRAAVLLRDYTGANKGVRITLKKQIPLAAGLAGGSTDAAGTLRALNRLWGLGLTAPELEELGSQLGSDVPFSLRGGTALARGRGEKLTFLEGPGDWWLTLVKIPVSISTAAVYHSFRLEAVTQQPDQEAMLDAIRKDRLKEAGLNLVNVLETVTIPWYPEIGAVRAEMVERGAIGALMSGSGPTVFGLVADRAEAIRLAAAFRDRYREVYVVRTLSNIGDNLSMISL